MLFTSLRRGARKIASLTCVKRANLEVTYRCNLRCKTCGLVREASHRTEAELDCSEWKRIVDELIELGFTECSVIGAEPLIRPDLFDIVSHIKSRGARVHLTTNAFLLDATRANRLVDLAVDTVTVSLDGPPEVHESIRRGNGLFRRLSVGLQHLHAARRRHNAFKPKIHIQTVVSRLNAESIERMIPFIKELYPDCWQFAALAETPQWAIERSIYCGNLVATRRFLPEGESLLVRQEQLNRLRAGLRQAQALCSNMRVAAEVVAGLSDWQLTSGSYPVHICRIVPRRITIDPWGKVYPCAHLDYAFGNVRSMPLRKILKDTARRRFIRRLRSRPFAVCRHCCNLQSNLLFRQLARLALFGKL